MAVALVGMAVPACAHAAGPPWVWHQAGSIDSKGNIEVACPSASSCLAVDAAGHVLRSDAPRSGATAWTSSAVPGAPAFTSLACASASVCTAGDSSGRIWTFVGRGAPTPDPVESGQPIAGVACPAAQLCVAVSGQDVLISSDPENGSWRVFKNAWFGGDYECVHYNEDNCQVPLASVSCSSRTDCRAVDGEGGLLDIDPATASFSGGSGIDPDLVINGSACVLGGECLIECGIGEGASDDCDFNGSTYAATAICDDGYENCYELSPNEFGWLSCPIVSLCFTSGTNGTLLASAHSGTAGTWKTVIRGTRSTAPYVPIQSLGCPNDRLCVGVNQNGDLFVGAPPPSSSALRTLMARWLRARRHDTYSFSSPSAGRLGVTWKTGHKLLAAATHAFRASGTARLTVSLTRTGRELLRERRRGLKITETATLAGLSVSVQFVA